MHQRNESIESRDTEIRNQCELETSKDSVTAVNLSI